MQSPYDQISIYQHSIFGNALKGSGVFIPLGNDSPIFSEIKLENQDQLQAFGETKMRNKNTNWAISDFGENREQLFRVFGYPQMVKENRFFHLGIDVWLTAETPIYNPYDGKVVLSTYESRPGDYGGLVVMEYRLQKELVYAVFGHLDKAKLPKQDSLLKKGEQIALIGNSRSNGGYFQHVHIQILTELGYKSGFMHKGYATKQQFLKITEYCQHPAAFIMK